VLLVAALAVSLLKLLPEFLAFLLLVALWATNGVVPTRVAASGFASSTWFLMLATMGLGVGLTRSGLLYRAALELLQRLPRRYSILATCLAGLGVLLVGGYAYRDQVEAAGRHILAELSPATPEITGQREVTLRAAGDGHFHVDARVNGAPVRMLLDTGASAVALTPEAAERAGIDPAKLDYDIPVQTANGTDRVARARIRELAVGTIVLRDVQAYVSRPGRLPEPLLGMSFLDRLGGFEKSGRKLILRQ
jgi:clan AA aspartic protease (TIGR02281 family)